VSKGGSLSCGNYDLYVYNGKLALLSDRSCNWAYASSTASVALNAWQHIAAVYDGSRVKYYINGALKDDKAWGGMGQTNTGTLEIGRQQSTAPGYFTGNIDELRVYNRALSAGELWMHYQSEFQKYNSTEWRFYTNMTGLAAGAYSTYGTYSYAGSPSRSEIRTLTVNV
jgi:hypothetical protein